MVLNATDPKQLADKLTVEALEGDWYITDRQPMTKEDYISIIAFATSDPIQIFKQHRMEAAARLNTKPSAPYSADGFIFKR